METTEKLENALLELVRDDASAALSVLTGLFVSLTIEVLRRQGHVPDVEIRIDGGDQRDITIHKPKTPKLRGSANDHQTTSRQLQQKEPND